jgi:hypothetical protein
MASVERGPAAPLRQPSSTRTTEQTQSLVATNSEQRAPNAAASSGGQVFGQITLPPLILVNWRGNDARPDRSLRVALYPLDLSAYGVGAPSTADTQPPTFSGISTAVAAGVTSVTLTWAQAVDNVTPQAEIWYDIHIGISAGLAFSPTHEVQGVGTVVIDGLTGGTAYYFRMRARDASGNLSSGDAVEVTATTDPELGVTWYYMRGTGTGGVQRFWKVAHTPDFTGTYYVGVDTPLSGIHVTGTAIF